MIPPCPHCLAIGKALAMKVGVSAFQAQPKQRWAFCDSCMAATYGADGPPTSWSGSQIVQPPLPSSPGLGLGVAPLSLGTANQPPAPAQVGLGVPLGQPNQPALGLGLHPLQLLGALPSRPTPAEHEMKKAARWRLALIVALILMLIIAYKRAHQTQEVSP